MLAFVINKHGRPLMPCPPAKARILLKQGKAKVVKRTPFTIQLLYGSSGYTQPITLGMDSGYSHIGLSAVTRKREVFAAEVMLCDDIVKLISARRQYRRSRRSRKTWYRKPRFLNRRKPAGWLAPSIQHKLDSHLKVIEQVKANLPITRINLEIAAFDIQKIKHPDILGTAYQDGEQSGFWNVREYVLHRDEHTCQHCKGESKDPILHVHHLVSRQVGGDCPDNLITFCRSCHRRYHLGEIMLEMIPSTGFKAETFMSTMRRMVVDRLKEAGVQVAPTYGYLTKQKRISFGLPKSHVNDAFVMAGGEGQKRGTESYRIRQVRRCNRKLFKGVRSHIRNTAERFLHGFQRFDKVLWKSQECFIFGRRKTGYFDLRTLDGTRVCASAKAQELGLLESFRTMLLERERLLPLPSTLERLNV